MNRLRLGLIVGASDEPRRSFEKVAEVGIPTCQLSCTAEKMVDSLNPTKIRRAADEAGIEISSFFLLFEGQKFNLKDGPATMGFIPERYREERLVLAKRFSDMVRDMGVNSITSHVGFIPDDPRDPLYIGFLDVMKEYAEYCAKNGQIFCFETGQELPSTLKRTILDVGTDNLGINLDPANLILYGMANPLDAVEIFGKYVRGMHAKDGLWPNRDEDLGTEVPLGEGKVNFRLLIPRLKEKGFNGPITIEREITGPQQKIDILKAKEILEPML
ncbi:MAG TPA: sugar phosphate isomerase/epimerase [Candidatus Latescibacteria bacterium]|nr:sugar phosphate isomerase/epimerase [Candidatus Latescibacterota bacterium]